MFAFLIIIRPSRSRSDSLSPGGPRQRDQESPLGEERRPDDNINMPTTVRCPNADDRDVRRLNQNPIAKATSPGLSANSELFQLVYSQQTSEHDLINVILDRVQLLPSDGRNVDALSPDCPRFQLFWLIYIMVSILCLPHLRLSASAPIAPNIGTERNRLLIYWVIMFSSALQFHANQRQTRQRHLAGRREPFVSCLY